MNLRPLGTNVIIEALNPEERTASGIIIPELAKKKTQQGKVVFVGPLVEGVKPGDDVLLQQFGPQEINFGDRSLLVCDEKEVIATIEQ